MADHKVRYAVVGLGDIAQQAILPAFQHAENSKLTALVSSDPVKLEALGNRYGIGLRYSYEQYGNLLKSGQIDAVYIALPNNLHRDYAIAAARARVHVLCEKPMAPTEKDCEEMIDEANRARIKLMIAYRLHFEEANLDSVRIAQSRELGELRIFDSLFTQQVLAPGNIRIAYDWQKGGGPVFDMGVYCINAVRYLFQDEPIEVFAFAASDGEERFREVEEMTTAVLRFPGDRLASFTCSFGAAPVSTYTLIGMNGSLRLEPAYEYAADMRQEVTVNGQTRTRVFPKRDQFAAEIVYFSDCILNNKEPEPSGLEGLADVRVIRAVYHSVETAKPVKLAPFTRTARPTIAQEIHRPPVEPPEVIHAKPPSGD